TIPQNNRTLPRYGTIRVENVKVCNGRTVLLDPAFNRQDLHSFPTRRSSDLPVPVGPVEHERLANEARTVGYRSRSRDSSVVAIQIGIAHALTPVTSHRRLRRGASGYTLAGAAGGENGVNFPG